MDWLVLDMDDGLLRREPTRKAALSWWMTHNGTDLVPRRAARQQKGTTRG